MRNKINNYKTNNLGYLGNNNTNNNISGYNSGAHVYSSVATFNSEFNPMPQMRNNQRE